MAANNDVDELWKLTVEKIENVYSSLEWYSNIKNSLQTKGIIAKNPDTYKFVSVSSERRTQDRKVYGFVYYLSIVPLHCFFAV